ncbi:hypothetical protein D1007_36433 [Hordeum vulgare]|nr:hypothetical protein D1007_36433 [Hordeum vulgare]
MPRGLLSFFLHLVRDGGRRRQSPRRRHGVGGLRRHNRHARDIRWFGARRNGFRRRALCLRHGARGHHGVGPFGASPEPAMPAAAPLPAWIFAGPAAPNLYADEVMERVDGAMDVDAVEPGLASPPPPHPCPVHGWWPCVTEVQEEVELAPPVLPAEPAQWDSLRLPSPTLAHETVVIGASAASFGMGMHLP